MMDEILWFIWHLSDAVRGFRASPPTTSIFADWFTPTAVFHPSFSPLIYLNYLCYLMAYFARLLLMSFGAMNHVLSTFFNSAGFSPATQPSLHGSWLSCDRVIVFMLCYLCLGPICGLASLSHPLDSLKCLSPSFLLFPGLRLFYLPPVLPSRLFFRFHYEGLFGFCR